jgi:predicted metal-dependent phosphoesterase TrpH
MADRFTAKQFRVAAADYKRAGKELNAAYYSQAADTEEMVEKIASADPALVAKVWDRIEVGGDSVTRVLRALAAVLKGDASHE